MTSKRLFADLLKENSKRRLVPIAASIACNFFAQIVFAILMMGRYNDRLFDNRTTISDVRADFFRNVAGVNSIPVLFIVTVLSIFIALQGYYYLFDSKQTDLYYSLPVRRQKIFDAFNLVGILAFVIPYVVCHIIIVIVALCRGYAEVGTIPMFMASAAVVILSYVLLYEFCVLAAVLTGHVVVAALGCLVFALLGPIVAILWESLMETFFVSYNGSSAGRAVLKMTPFSAVMDMGKALVGNNNKVVVIYPQNAVVPVVIALVLIVGCFFLSRFLIDRRPAEAAGKSMAFEITKPVIKIIMMVVAAIGGGLVFYYASEYGNLLIFAFGMVCAILVVHFVMETIFEFDFKASFGHFGSTAVGALISAIVLLICVFDLLGYETWQPMPDRVASVSFSDDIAYGNLKCPFYRVEEFDDDVSYFYTIDSRQFAESEMILTDMENVEKLTRQGAINAMNEHRKSRFFGTAYNNTDSIYMTEDADYYTYVNVKWTMKNGKEIRRRYNIDLYSDELVEAYRRVFESKEYKLGKIPVLTMDYSEADEIYCDTVDGGYLEKISKDDLQGLIEAYKDDVLNQSFDDLTNEIPSVEIECCDKKNNGDGASYNFYVYPSFVKTNAYLKKIDVPTSWRDGEENIKELTLGVQFWDNDGNNYRDEYFTTADKKEIANVLDNYYPGSIVDVSSSVNKELRKYEIGFDDQKITFRDVTFSTSAKGDRGGAESSGYIKFDEGLSKNVRDFCFPTINEETEAANSGNAGWTTLVSNHK